VVKRGGGLANGACLETIVHCFARYNGKAFRHNFSQTVFRLTSYASLVGKHSQEEITKQTKALLSTELVDRFLYQL
jgi:hypothetical protein